MADRPYKKTNSKALVAEYNRLKKAKSRARRSSDKAEVENALNAVLNEFKERGLNTRGTEKKPQGNPNQCFCSRAEVMMGRHRPNCRGA